MWSKEEIKLKNLKLWDENPRFPDEYFQKKDKDLIDFYLKDEKRFELRKFAKEIVDEFDLPQVERLLVFRLKGENIVLEGNRRIAVYKLLVDPYLAKQQTDIDYFEELSEKISITENFKLETNVTTDKEIGLKLVDRKHKKRNNEVGWGELERRNDSVRRSKASLPDIRKVELSKFVHALELPKEIIDKVLGRGYITTLYRIIDSEPAREKMEYTVLKNGKPVISNEERFTNLLKVIVYNVSTKKRFTSGKGVDSRSLNSTEEIRKYLNSISEKDVKKVEKALNLTRKAKVLEKKQKNASSKLLPSCFVIMSLSGLEEVYKAIQSAWWDVFGKKAKVYHQLDDNDKGGKELIDNKILRNIQNAKAVVCVLSMGSKERVLFQAIPRRERELTFKRVFPFNVNVALETGYAMRCVDDRDATLEEYFFIADNSEKVSAYEFAKSHFFDISHRDITAYKTSDLDALKRTLIRQFKSFKKKQGL